MAAAPSSSFLLLLALVFSAAGAPALADLQYEPAVATWYGQPDGAGPDDNGGACGFKNVNQPPFASMTSCGNAVLFKGGKGCGSCYKVRCTSASHSACSGEPLTVVITDLNDYQLANPNPVHFDLSGTAFGAMAKLGLNDTLRGAGFLHIEYARVPCEYPGRTVTFHVEDLSNPFYLAVLVEYADGDGDIFQVNLLESTPAGAAAPRQWEPMRESWGSIWRYDSDHPLQAPFSLRITSESGKTLVADDVIPADWKPNTFYRSYIQFSN